MTQQEAAAALIALCIAALFYLLGERIRSERALPKFRWGDPQRRDDGELAWWAGDGACLVYVAFAWALLYRVSSVM